MIKYKIGKYLIVQDSRSNVRLIRVRMRNTRVEDVINVVPEEERGLAALAVALAIYRAKKADAILALVRRAFLDETKRKVLLALAEHYAAVALSIGRGYASRMSHAVRVLLRAMP